MTTPKKPKLAATPKPLRGVSVDLSRDMRSILISLAWLGELSTEQIQRLWGWSRDKAGRTLRLLKSDNYVARRMLMRPGRSTYNLTTRQAALWSLTEAARVQIRQDNRFPPKYLPPRDRRVATHDWHTSDIFTRVIELAREYTPVLSGVRVEREFRLDPKRTRPIVDLLIMLRFGGRDLEPVYSGIPWPAAPYFASDRRRRYALENDRNTEEIYDLAEKALSYRETNTPEWRATYGMFPIPMIVTTNVRRMNAIHAEWARLWPEGLWLITTDAGVAADVWRSHEAGKCWRRHLFAGPTADPAEALGATIPNERRENRATEGG